MDIPDNFLLVTFDLASIYTNIPHKDGIAAVVEVYKRATHKLSIDEDVISTLIKLILEYNHFELEHKCYLHINGTAIDV